MESLNYSNQKITCYGKLVKEMFDLDKWGDEEYKKKLQELVTKDEELVRDVIRKIKLEKGF